MDYKIFNNDQDNITGKNHRKIIQYFAKITCYGVLYFHSPLLSEQSVLLGCPECLFRFIRK